MSARNRVRDGLVYLQITRGVARRDFAFPTNELRPTLVVTAKGANAAINAAHAAAGVKVITVPETRWAHPHIKSLQLLPNVLAKQAARETGAFEAWFVDAQGFVTEGASSNAWIVGADRRLVTRQADAAILRGVTRTTLLDVARRLGLRFEERPFARDEAYAAREAFNSSATTIAMPVVEIDGRAIGDGKPGPVVKALRAAFHEFGAKLMIKFRVGAGARTRTTRGEGAIGLRSRGAGSARPWGVQPGRVIRPNNREDLMASEKAQNLQDTFLNHVRKSRRPR